jgi:hypothetical protein
VFADDELSPSHKAVGQVIEWLVWAAIVGHSERITHLFLPLDDRGVDGIIRRIDDEAMCAVQVKGRSSLRHSELCLQVVREALDDLNVTFVFALLDPVQITLGQTVYVMDAADVLEHGRPTVRLGIDVLNVDMPYPPKPGSRWQRFACPLPELATRLFPSAGNPLGTTPTPTEPRAAAHPEIPAPPRRRELLGHLAELEVMRLVGEPPTLNTFKSFPDLEEAEYLVRHRPSGNIRGVQVKCLIVPDAEHHSDVDIHGPSFVASPNIDIVVLAWREDRRAFDDAAWIIPAVDIPHLITTDGYTLHLKLRISDDIPSRFDRYRVRRQAVPEVLEARVTP